MSSYKHFDPKVTKKRKKARSKSSATRYELYVLKTNKNIVATLYDKLECRDVTAVTTRPKSFASTGDRKKDAVEIGKKFAEICKKHKIEKLYLNKLNYKFHGILASVVEGVRSSGINI